MNNEELVKTLKTTSQAISGNIPLKGLLVTSAERIKEMTEVISSAYASAKDNNDSTLDLLERFVRINMADLFVNTVPGELDSDKLSNVGYQISLLAKYPRVQANISTLWGTLKGRSLLSGLVVDDRDRDHSKVQGFPEPILATLTNLLELHDRFYPQFKPSQTVWDYSSN